MQSDSYMYDGLGVRQLATPGAFSPTPDPPHTASVKWMTQVRLSPVLFWALTSACDCSALDACHAGCRRAGDWRASLDSGG